ncbi:MAG: hydroxymethylglutaryl-CoA reductase, degradative [Bacteroidia bacterium]|jgi:hydroxymethylglutaryl-CoA reductase|nr:hydroxymethylglutaryl-CoA reductase, degradative [Bacteroidia bacterium]
MKNTSVDPIKGFSKLSKQAKMEWLVQNFSDEPNESLQMLQGYWHTLPEVQKLHDEFIENTVSNYYLPFGVAPNFQINQKMYTIPFAIEESSVVAAAAKAANFWLDRGGFKTTVLSTTKVGHVHFIWDGQDHAALSSFFSNQKDNLISSTDEITKNMRARGGGILDIELIDKSELETDYFQLAVKFDTRDSMGANFINSCLETIAKEWQSSIEVSDLAGNVQIVMSILSNYTPECVVRAEVSCAVEDINEGSGISNEEFAEKFRRAIRIAQIEPYRAVTHNKGIMNGIDSVIIATGNDFRATEACAHAYAARDGQYRSLTNAEVIDGTFRFWLDLPLSVGTVGGIISLHPMVKFAHELLGNPDAEELMQIIAVAGLAQNFSAVRSLITSGIQKGHMKMHLLNILNQLEATEDEKSQIVEYFKDKVVSFSAAVEIFSKLRGIPVDQKVKK